jgi:hypothetical protein
VKSCIEDWVKCIWIVLKHSFASGHVFVQGNHDITLKSSIVWDIMPCSPLKVNWRFGGTRRLHQQDRIISQQETWGTAGSFHLLSRRWRWKRYVPPKPRLTFNWLHRMLSQTVEFLITTGVRTSILRNEITLLEEGRIGHCRCQKSRRVFVVILIIRMRRFYHLLHRCRVPFGSLYITHGGTR